MKKPNKLPLPTSKDFEDAVDLLALYSDASNELDALQAGANDELLELLDEKKKEYAKWQEILAKTEAALEALALKHPDWFTPNRRSIKTPYGTMKLHSSTKLEVKNEEVTLLLIEQEMNRQEVAAATDPSYQRPFDAAKLRRTHVALNLEAIEQLDDATLKQFRIVRAKKDNFSVVPAKLDMGKAVSEAVAAEQKAA